MWRSSKQAALNCAKNRSGTAQVWPPGTAIGQPQFPNQGLVPLQCGEGDLVAKTQKKKFYPLEGFETDPNGVWIHQLLRNTYFQITSETHLISFKPKTSRFWEGRT